MALYYQYLSNEVTHEVEGGQGSKYEHGASGTVYLKEEWGSGKKVLKSYNNFPTASSQVGEMSILQKVVLEKAHSCIKTQIKQKDVI